MEYFKPGIRMTLFAACFFPVLMYLGLWQVDRGSLKRQLETQYLQQLTVLPLERAEISMKQDDQGDYQPFTRIRLSGTFTQRAFLLDNQVHDGTTGYWAYHVFETSSGERFLVNRGFLAAASQRNFLPVIPTTGGVITIVATVWPDLGLPPIFASEPWTENWPKRIQRRNLERMADAAKARAVELRLEAGQPGVLIAAPFAQKLSDLKHRGYALTWFGLAGVLLVSYLAFGLRRARQSD